MLPVSFAALGVLYIGDIEEANLIGRSALKCGVVKSAVMLAKSFIQQRGVHQGNSQ